MFQKKKLTLNNLSNLFISKQAITVYEHNLTHLMAPKLFVFKQVVTIRVTRSHRGQDRLSIQKITVDNSEIVSKL